MYTHSTPHTRAQLPHANQHTRAAKWHACCAHRPATPFPHSRYCTAVGPPLPQPPCMKSYLLTGAYVRASNTTQRLHTRTLAAQPPARRRNAAPTCAPRLPRVQLGADGVRTRPPPARSSLPSPTSRVTGPHLTHAHLHTTAIGRAQRAALKRPAGAPLVLCLLVACRKPMRAQLIAQPHPPA